MALDLQAKGFLDASAEQGAKDFSEMTVLEARSLNAGFPDIQGDAEEVASVRDLLVRGSAGMLPARVYHPAPGETLPVLVYFHGGGWVIGSIDVVDRMARTLANSGRCVVVTVGYRVSPETKFPGPVEDCYEATSWVAEHVAELGGDPNWIAVGGDSAGANMAAAVALMARDRKGPSLAFQLLIYPTVATAKGTTFASYETNGYDYMTTKASMEWFYEHYLADPADAENPYAVPLRAKDFSGLPPAHVLTAEYDPLHDEGVAYADALAKAGVPTTTSNYEGAIHGFIWMAGVIDMGKTALNDLGKVLREAYKSSR